MTCGCTTGDDADDIKIPCVAHAAWAEKMMRQQRVECLRVLDSVHAAIEDRAFQLRLSSFKGQEIAPVWRRVEETPR